MREERDPAPHHGTQMCFGGAGGGVGWRRIATLSCLATPQTPIVAAVCRKLPHQERKYLLLLDLVSLCQRESRQFESGLVFQTNNSARREHGTGLLFIDDTDG
jgi:hypothetical protein